MPHLIWSRVALRDVQRIYRFLARKDPQVAMRAIAAIRRGVSPLTDFPDMGRLAGKLGPGVRRWVVQFGNEGYVIMYKVDATAVTLLSLRHQKESGP
jgi:plasmid stabilization system protein ParE